MFENLSEKLDKAFKILKGQGSISEINVAQTMKEIRKALLAADVDFKTANKVGNFRTKVRNGSVKMMNNIILDFYSNNTIDGSYLHAADVYIGDVSSMVTDFIIKKNRSCIFINSYDIDWRNDKSFNFWNCGKVINKLEEFDSAITCSLKQNKYVKSQQAYIKKMIHKVSISSSKLIADSIYKNLQK